MPNSDELKEPLPEVPADPPSGPEADPEPVLSAAERRTVRNRANAQRSTGPRTEAGKKRCRKNALKHGGRASFIHSLEDTAECNLIERQYKCEYRPQGPLEYGAVRSLVFIQYRRASLERQIIHLELILAAEARDVPADSDVNARLAAHRHDEPVDMAELDRLHRYHRQADLDWHRSALLLTRLQRTRKLDGRAQREEDRRFFRSRREDHFNNSTRATFARQFSGGFDEYEPYESEANSIEQEKRERERVRQEQESERERLAAKAAASAPTPLPNEPTLPVPEGGSGTP